MNNDSLKYVVFVQLGIIAIYFIIKLIAYCITKYIERKEVKRLLKQINKIVQDNDVDDTSKLNIKSFRGDVYKDGK